MRWFEPLTSFIFLAITLCSVSRPLAYQENTPDPDPSPSPSAVQSRVQPNTQPRGQQRGQPSIQRRGQPGYQGRAPKSVDSPPTSSSGELKAREAPRRKTHWAAGYSWSGWSEDLNLIATGSQDFDLSNYQSFGPKFSWALESYYLGSGGLWGIELGQGSNIASGGGQNSFGYRQAGYTNSSFSLSVFLLAHIGSGWLLGLAPQAHFRPQDWVSNLSGLQVRHKDGSVIFVPIRWLIPLTTSLALQQDFGPVLNSPYSFFSSALLYRF